MCDVGAQNQSSDAGVCVAIAKNTLYGSKLFYFMSKIIRTLNKDHVP